MHGKQKMFMLHLHPYMVCKCKFAIQKIFVETSNFQDLVVSYAFAQ
jgi:hypothetical protein